MSDALMVQPDIVIPASELVWTAVRASGPGGQNVNKVASKVELRWDLAHTAVVSTEVRARIMTMVRSRIDADGKVLITSQRTRDQHRNLDDARARLVAIILRALVPPTVRTPTQPSRASQRRRVNDKLHQGERKRDRKRVHTDD